MTRRRVEADVEQFKRLVEDASVEFVETPTGRKDVEIAYEDSSDKFIEEDGTAVGVYWEYSDAVGLDGEPEPAIEVVHIDWADERARTSVKWDDVVTFEESEYYSV